MKEANLGRAEAETETVEEAEPGAADPTIERLLQHVSAHPLVPDAAPPLRTARVAAVQGDSVQIAWRGRREAIAAELGGSRAYGPGVLEQQWGRTGLWEAAQNQQPPLAAE